MVVCEIEGENDLIYESGLFKYLLTSHLGSLRRIDAADKIIFKDHNRRSSIWHQLPLKEGLSLAEGSVHLFLENAL